MRRIVTLPSDLIQRARQTPIERVIEARAIRLRGRSDRCGPCPNCNGVDRFSINVRKGVFNCRGCGVGGDVISLVQFLDGSDFSTAVETLSGERIGEDRPRLPKLPSRADDAEIESERAKAQWLWGQRRPIAGTIAEIYLREARGYGGVLPPTLGFLPARGDHPPALIAAFGMASEPEPGLLAIVDDAVKAVQLVKLKPDGSGKSDIKPNKIIIGQGALGSPIVLAPPNDLLGLAICEGIENALSVHAATGLGGLASGGAGRMPALADPVPSYVQCTSIFGDDDAAGRRNAPRLAVRLEARGFQVMLKFLRAGSST